MRVINAKEDDRRAISKLHYKLYTGVEDKKPIPLAGAMIKNIVLVAKDEGRVIGYISGNFVKHGLERTGFINDLFIDKKHRGRGIGTKLMKSIMNDFKELKADFYFISAEKENRGAIQLYKRLGFHPDDSVWLYKMPHYFSKKKKMVKRGFRKKKIAR